MADLAPIMSFTFAREGGYQCAPSDPGNWTGAKRGWGKLVGTNMGISAAVLLARRRKLARNPSLMISAQDMRDLTQAEATAIYTEEFADPMFVSQAPAGPDLMLFDAAIMHGDEGTTEIAQGVAGADIDGEMGPKTIAAIEAYGAAAFVVDFDLAFTAMLKQCEDWPDDGEGWTNRGKLRLAAAQALVAA